MEFFFCQKAQFLFKHIKYGKEKLVLTWQSFTKLYLKRMQIKLDKLFKLLEYVQKPFVIRETRKQLYIKPGTVV